MKTTDTYAVVNNVYVLTHEIYKDKLFGKSLKKESYTYLTNSRS